jgi:molecular chaperone GrpE
VNLHNGLQLAETVFLSTLEKHGLVRFDPSEKGEKFDPNMHEAVFQAPQPEKEDGTVFHTQQKGYSLNGRVLRAAQVGVVKNS